MKSPITNAVELVSCVSPRPSLIISCGFTWSDRLRADRTHNFANVGLPFVRSVYQRSGVPDRLEHIHLADEAHDFGPTKRAAVYAFLGKYLQLPVLPEDLDRVAIESPEQMQVFDQTHPLPKHAAQGSRQIAQAFKMLTTSP